MHMQINYVSTYVNYAVRITVCSRFDCTCLLIGQTITAGRIVKDNSFFVGSSWELVTVHDTQPPHRSSTYQFKFQIIYFSLTFPWFWSWATGVRQKGCKKLNRKHHNVTHWQDQYDD